MRRLGNGSEHLSRTDIRGANHANFTIAIRERGGPLDRIEAVRLFVPEGIPFPFGSVTAAYVLNDDHIAARDYSVGWRDSPAGALVVRRAHKDDRELARGSWAIDVRVEHNTVARLHRNIVLSDDVDWRR